MRCALDQLAGGAPLHPHGSLSHRPGCALSHPAPAGCSLPKAWRRRIAAKPFRWTAPPAGRLGVGGRFPCCPMWWSWLRSNPAFEPTHFVGGSTFTLGPPYSRFMQARIYSSASPFSSVFPLGFWPCGGLRLGLVRFFKPFRPLALAQQALVAIILQVLRRFRGAALFRSVRPSSTWGFPFWPMGLTVQSSRPAFCGRLTFGR